MGREREAIRAAKADNAQLAEQLNKEREARTAAEQQVSCIDDVVLLLF